MALHFDKWIKQEFGKGAFTALVMLVEIGEDSVEPVASTFLHVIGDEVDWFAMKATLDQAPHAWQGAAFFPARLAEPGPISDELARIRLHDLKQQVLEDRLVLNKAAFFDRLGRLMQIEEAGNAPSSLH